MICKIMYHYDNLITIIIITIITNCAIHATDKFIVRTDLFEIKQSLYYQCS